MKFKFPDPRKAFVCKSCEHVYLDVCVTSCDCMPVVNEFTEVSFYTEAQLKKACRDVLEEAAMECETAKLLYSEGTLYSSVPGILQLRSDNIRNLRESIK